MKQILLSLVAAAALCFPTRVLTQTSTLVQPAAESSSSSADLAGPGVAPVAAPHSAAMAAGIQGPPPAPAFNRPFRSIALAAKLGTNGIGFDVATPVAPHLKVRAGVQFFGHTVGFTVDGLQSNAAIQLQSAALSADVYPFHNGFHLSPGVTLGNQNHISASINVPGGQPFTLGGTDFTSSNADPVSGSGSIRLGGSIAPRFTLGWDDVLRHHGGRISLPVEFGFQHSSAPSVSLTLAGSACTQGVCGPVMADGRVTAVQQEIVKIQGDLQPLRFYPITSTGVRYTFGR